MHIKIITLLLLLTLTSLSAKVTEYQEIYQTDNTVFKNSISVQIKKEVKNHTEELQDLYAQIKYQPVWISKDQITHDAEVLLDEIQLDINQGFFSNLDQTYQDLLKEVEILYPDRKIVIEKRVNFNKHEKAYRNQSK